ncbi:hypothetical protein Caci_4377 [Catenulispora acidiphila DSM 44928]|uniref:Lipoprotein n=1 Tax=Catenulispora acidiphila (strain DSM 44928 / JCM 14897 / NBRC 102108 / NRRL B-24433 / ID139908) TaxID=479433 RepID=C7QK03_CATAD|nr:hypothetical protein [Catenulispora acidiphila]ACU73241.1 hypothetical protein Caci_4377 [Catenulispora acidiphila DSM 44928]
MSTRPRIPVSVGVACAALLLAGCSSSGTIGAGTTSSTGGSVTGGGITGGKTGGSSGATGTDSGCAQAILAIQGAEKAQNSASPQTQLKGVQTSIGQLRSAAQTTRKPGGKDAMNKVADDLQTIINQAESGQTPSTQQALNDAQVVATICGV